MVQNAGFVLKNRQGEGHERLEIVAFYQLYNLYFH